MQCQINKSLVMLTILCDIHTTNYTSQNYISNFQITQSHVECKQEANNFIVPQYVTIVN